MVTCYDPDYKATKLIKQGKVALEPPFAEMADWISSTWQVAVLNVIYDQLEVPKERPRLQVIVEDSRDRDTFFDGYNFDQLKQQSIAARFTEVVDRQQPTQYNVDRLLVVVSAFAPLAREEADSNISEVEVAALQKRLANPHLWTIHRCFGHVTFMFYSDEQARSHADEGFRKTYADLYFELLRANDEFKYLDRSRFSVAFDSKENFDRNYGGSWFNYDR